VPFGSLILILFGIVLILVAVLRYRPRVRIGSVRGNVIGGDASGTTTQTYSARETSKPDGVRVRDVIGWLIALLGVAITAYGVYLQMGG
jgi:hypothetical protein